MTQNRFGFEFYLWRSDVKLLSRRSFKSIPHSVDINSQLSNKWYGSQNLKFYWPNQFNHLVSTQPNVGSIRNFDGLMVKALVIEKLVRNSPINKEIMSEEYYQQKLKF